MKTYWHICTDGLAKNIIFRTNEDYISGMNGVAVYASMYNITVLAFCLMSNHVHFILHGEETECRNFIRSYKKRLASMTDLAGTDTYAKQITDITYLKKAICYVLRNPSVADRKILPTHYRWGSGGLYFNGGAMPEKPAGNISGIGIRETRKRWNTRNRLPADFCITEDGLICPQCYVDHEAVERLFGTSVAMLFFLSRNDNMEMELTEEILRKVHYTDSELVNSVENSCLKMFGTKYTEDLSLENKCRLAMELRKRYGIGTKQASRLTGLSPELLRHFTK